MPSSSSLHGHWQCESSHKNPPPCFCLQTMKCTSPRFGQINFRGHIEHSVTPFLVSFITNSMDWIFICLLSCSLLTKFHTALHTPPTPVAHDIPPPLIFLYSKWNTPYQIPTRRGRRMGKICSNYPRSAILASNPPIFSTPLFFSKTNSMNRRAHVNSTIPTHHHNHFFCKYQ